MIELNKSVEKIREELFEFIEDKQEDYVKEGFLPAKINLNKGIIRGMLEVFIFGIWQLYNMMSKLLMQAIPINSTGDWLKLHAESIGVIPKKKTKAKGFVQFTRDSSKIGNINIAKNKIVGTLPDGLGQVYRYLVNKDTVLLANEKSVLVEVESEEYGEKVNASANQIIKLVTPIGGIDGVTNNRDWLISEGTDDENDSSLKERYVAQWKRITGVTRDAYFAIAMSVVGVKSVSIDDNHPRGQGTIDVYIIGTGEDVSGRLLDNVKNALASEIVINDDVLVTEPKDFDIEIEMEVEIKGAMSQDVINSVENNVKTYMRTLRIGEDVVRDRVAATIINIEGVKTINWQRFNKAPIHLTPIKPAKPVIPLTPIEPIEPIEPTEPVVFAKNKTATKTAKPTNLTETETPAKLVEEVIVITASELAKLCHIKVTTKEIDEGLNEAE